YSGVTFATRPSTPVRLENAATSSAATGGAASNVAFAAPTPTMPRRVIASVVSLTPSGVAPPVTCGVRQKSGSAVTGMSRSRWVPMSSSFSAAVSQIGGVYEVAAPGVQPDHRTVFIVGAVHQGRRADVVGQEFDLADADSQRAAAEILPQVG